MIWLVMITATVTGAVGMVDLARDGEWAQIFEVAEVRSHQLPLRPDEAMMAAVAARKLGHDKAAERYLELAIDNEGVGDVARVELGRLRVKTDAERAAATVIPLLKRSPTREIRLAAIEVVVEAIDRGLEDSALREIEAASRRYRRSQKRPLEYALATQDETAGRRRKVKLLESSRQDEVSLRAARDLLAEDNLSLREKWLAARTLYQHALYAEAEPLLDELASTPTGSGFSTWEVALTRGRCAFRAGRWLEAAAWYQKAIEKCTRRDNRASLHVHHSRALELEGNLENAIEEARQAVIVRTTDERRLFLARLRLKADQIDLAAQGISAMRSRSFRVRGEMVRAVYELSQGNPEAAHRRLTAIRRDPWRGPAAVLAAEVSAGQEDWKRALDTLERASRALDGFWAAHAQRILREVPEPIIDEWRQHNSKQLASGSERNRRDALITSAVLEPQSERLDAVRSQVLELRPFHNGEGEPEFRAGIAGRLWSSGLEELAQRWHPSGFPSGQPGEILWTAGRFEATGQVWRTVRLADHAWRVAGSDLPVRVYPKELVLRLFPLPSPEAVRRAANDASIPWSLLAGVVREESRWDPEAFSRVGARGLAQLMPATSAEVARRLGDSEPTPGDLFKPEVSLRLGAAEIGRLLDRFGGFQAPAIAAYNAGEAQAQLWLDACGSDCTETRYAATISFDATRRYTVDVLWAASMYEQQYGAGIASAEIESPQDVRVPAPANARSRH
ncbi:MAG: lytic transglycosylase domain-containing protein [bacterium]|nr:lytic transglycosylase domain-containing protein [bacterium]